MPETSQVFDDQAVQTLVRSICECERWQGRRAGR